MKRKSNERSGGSALEVVKSLQYCVIRSVEKDRHHLPIYLSPSCSCLPWRESNDTTERLPSSVEPLSVLYENIYISMAETRTSTGTVCLSSLKYGIGVLQSVISADSRPTSTILQHLLHSIMLEVSDGDVLCQSLALLRSTLELHPPKCRRARLMYHEAMCGSHPSAWYLIEKAVVLAVNTPVHSDCLYARLHFVDWLMSVLEFDMAVWYTQCMSVQDDGDCGVTAVVDSLTNETRRCLLARAVWLNDVTITAGHRTQPLCHLISTVYTQCDSGPASSLLTVSLHRLLLMVAECVRLFSQSEVSGPFCVSESMVQFAMQLARSFVTLYDRWSQDDTDSFLTQLRPHWLLVLVSATVLEWRHSRSHITDLSLSSFIENYISQPPAFSSATGDIFRSLQVVLDSGRSRNSVELPSFDELCRTDENGNTWLHRVCSKGQCELLYHALCRHPTLDRNSINCSGRSPLHEACSSGHIGCVLLLLQHPTDSGKQMSLKSCSRLFALDFSGYTPFHCAVVRDHVPVVSGLLKYADGVLRQQLLTKPTADDVSSQQLAKSQQMTRLLTNRDERDSSQQTVKPEQGGSVDCRWRYSMVMCRLILGYISWLRLFDVCSFLTRHDRPPVPRLSASFSPPDSLIVTYNRQLRVLISADGASVRRQLRAAASDGTLDPQIALRLLTLISR